MTQPYRDNGIISQRKNWRSRKLHQAVWVIGCVAVLSVAAVFLIPLASDRAAPAPPGSAVAKIHGSALVLGHPPARICQSPPVSPYSHHYAGSSDAEIAYTSGAAGLPTYGSAGTDFPRAKHGFIIPTGGADGSSTSNDSVIWAKGGTIANAVYWFTPGIHHGSYQIHGNDNDAFVGAPGAVISGSHKGGGIVGSGTGVTVEYLTLSDIGGHVDGAGWAALNSDLSADWKMEDLVVKGTGDAAINIGPHNLVKNNCLTHNGQAGIIGYNGYGSVIKNNEVSFNDPLKGGDVDYGSSPIECGCAGGIKLLQETNDRISGNYIHGNGDAGIWLDTNNAGITIMDNYISDNPSTGITYEASYDGLIQGNLFADNSIASNANVQKYGYPAGAIYVANSGSLPASTGLKVTPYCVTERTCPASTPVACNASTSCQKQFQIIHNTFVNNWDGVIIYTNDTRNVAYCPSGTPPPGSCAEKAPVDHEGTLVGGTIWGGNKVDPEGIVPCYNAQGAAAGGSPNYWEACIWTTMGIRVANNIFSLNPATVDSKIVAESPPCTIANKCGISGLFAFDGGCCATGNYNPGNGYHPPGCPSESNPPFTCGRSQDADISYDWGNKFYHNSYYGPWRFWAWEQSNLSLPYSWAMWTGLLSRCVDSSATCDSNFGQDKGSTITSSGGPAWDFTG